MFSREVYHTKRMFIARCVKWSKDNKFIYNGSDETNIRVWKSRPAEKIGPVSSGRRGRDGFDIV